MEIETLIGLNIQKIRKSLGLSQTEASDLTGIPQGRLSELEAGKHRAPTIKTLLKISKAYKVSLTELIQPEPKDLELSEKIAAIEKLPKEDQKILNSIIEKYLYDASQKRGTKKQ